MNYSLKYSLREYFNNLTHNSQLTTHNSQLTAHNSLMLLHNSPPSPLLRNDLTYEWDITKERGAI